jgi:hypothetical protein
MNEEEATDEEHERNSWFGCVSVSSPLLLPFSSARSANVTYTRYERMEKWEGADDRDECPCECLCKDYRQTRLNGRTSQD